MGWASAGDIFDPVAQSLIDCGATADMKRTVLGRLIAQLQAGGWDTEDSSLDAFRHDPAIVAAFYANDVGNSLTDWPDETQGVIDYDESGIWVLTCSEHGDVDSGDGNSAVEHDRLVYRWAAHFVKAHDGDGTVREHMLIGGGV